MINKSEQDTRGVIMTDRAVSDPPEKCRILFSSGSKHCVCPLSPRGLFKGMFMTSSAITLRVSRSRISFLFLAIAMSFVLGQPARSQQGDAKEKSSEPFQIRRSLVFERATFGPTTIDLGSLKAGAKGEIKIEIQNATADDFKVKRTVTTCGCMAAEMGSNTIAAGKSQALSVSLKVPTQSETATQTHVIRIEADNSSLIQIVMQFEIDGICCFAKPSCTIIAPVESNIARFKVPLTVSADVDAKDIKLSGTGDLGSVSGTFTNDNGIPRFECSLQLPSEKIFRLTGDLRIENAKLGISHNIPCFVYREAKVTLSPGVVRFFRDGEKYKATVMLRLNRSLLPSDPKSNEFTLLPSAAIASHQIDLKTKNIGLGICRLTLALDEIDLFDKQSEVFVFPKGMDWQVTWDGGIAEFSSPVTFN